MQKLFNKILVPVDFSAKSKIAAEKAIEIARQCNCSIHLLYVSTTSVFVSVGMAEGHAAIPLRMIDNEKELDFEMEKIVKNINLLSGNSIITEYQIVSGTWHQAIIDFIGENEIDLVLIGQKGSLAGKRKMHLNPNFIAEKTNVPVITIPSNRALTRIYSIIIPVTDFLPVRKLMYGMYMASFCNAVIKLLAIQNNQTKQLLQYYLAKANNLIRDNCNIKIESETIVNKNVAEGITDFAMSHSTDLIIVNPGGQSKMPGFFSSLLGNIIQKYSAPPVLTVNPV